MQQSTHVQGWEGSLHWQQTDKAMLRRISLLILDTQREPLADVGKSESLNLVLAATGRGASATSIASIAQRR